MSLRNQPEKAQLSARKTAYLTARTHPSYQLRSSDLDRVAAYSESKFNNTIYIAGDAKSNSSVYKELLEITSDQAKQFTSLANLCISRWNKPHLTLNFKEQVQKQLKEAGYLEKDDTLRNIKQDEIEEFDKKLASILQQKNKYIAALQFLKDVNKAAEEEKKKLSERFKLHKYSYTREIKDIQSRLKEDEIVGYMMPNEAGHPPPVRSHIEVVIISKDKIIKPVNWITEPWYMMTQKDLPEMHTVVLDLSDLSPLDKTSCEFLRKEKNPTGAIVPQLGSDECGALCFAYLNDLLKDNAYQLKHYTLAFTYYTPNPQDENKPNKVNFFFPSPQVLRYSQSTLYNLAFFKMLESNEDWVEATHNKQTVRTKSLRKVLFDSMQLAQKNNDPITMQQNKNILDCLPSFSEKWLAAYQVSSAKRDTMNDKSGKNLYLPYTSTRLEHVQPKKTTKPSPLSTTAMVLATLPYDKQSGQNTLTTNPLLAPEVANPDAIFVEAYEIPEDGDRQLTGAPSLPKFS